MQKALSYQGNKQTEFTSNEENRIPIESIDFIEASGTSPFIIERGKIYDLGGNLANCKKLLQSLDLRNENFYGLKCNGHDLKNVSVYDFKSRTAWCDHLPVILEDTFFANVKWNTQASNEEVIAAAELVGLNQFYAHSSKGIYLETQHRDEFWSLENRALLELARAIVAKPDLLVLRNQYILQHPKGIEIIQSEFKDAIVIIHNITEIPLSVASKIQIN
jgi:ABC-type transport system involved in Fe-S cluster assembly fused permease/ATPase subunit